MLLVFLQAASMEKALQAIIVVVSLVALEWHNSSGNAVEATAKNMAFLGAAIEDCIVVCH